MLAHSRGTPEGWYSEGQAFGVDAMATWFGPVSFRITSTQSEAEASVTFGSPSLPQDLVLSFRRPNTQIGEIKVEGAELLLVDQAIGSVHLRAIEPAVRVVALLR